jgi:protein-tyrosine phosphatase
LFKNIIVLCTGNICRSPMAEVVLRERLRGQAPTSREGETDSDPIKVMSAGTSALVGYPADPFAVEVAGRFGFDLSLHRGQQALTPLLSAADLVLVMERAHAEWVHRQAPPLRGRVQLLGRWREQEIADPYGQRREVFEACFEQIDDCVADWLPRLA